MTVSSVQKDIAQKKKTYPQHHGRLDTSLDGRHLGRTLYYDILQKCFV